MECNKDEALRAKSIAEDKMEKKDFAGARKFALKAQTLFPGLDGIPQILTTVDVYISAENKINGEVDWYGILGVTPLADDEVIRKQYRKLALTLHPDKNKSIGAEGAFKLISEAWSLLSDKAKRLVHNQRRGSKGFQQNVPMRSGGGSKGFHQNVPMHSSGPSAPPRANGLFNSKTQNNSGKAPVRPNPAPTRQRTDTFWTLCQKCMMHYEYLKVYLNTTLICPNCSEAFTALRTAPPFDFSSNSSNPVPSQTAKVQGQNGPAAKKSGPNQTGQRGPSPFTHSQRDPLLRTSNIGSTDPSIAAKAANVVQQAHDKLKRSYTELSSQASAGWEGYFKKNKLGEGKSHQGMGYNMAQGSGGLGTSGGAWQGSRSYGFSGNFRQQPNSTRDLTTPETRKMLMERAKIEILNRVKMWKLESSKAAADEEKKSTKKSMKEKLVQNGKSDLSSTASADQQEKNPVSAGDASKDDSMNVPDPDFHDFDQNRTENSFGDNEVWAAYDDDDGMPRFYALISKVLSKKPFKLKISWLNSRTNTEFSNLDWLGSGFYKTCGEFRVGKYETCKSINSFSQKVNWSKGPRGAILILPHKGDVWALYRNWSPDWDEHTPDEVIHKYDMVTILDDYNEEKGVSVAPLEKVVGFKTVFRTNSDPKVIKWVPKEEMFRFSHRVPNHLLTGEEGQNCPKGCIELDPAATPLELLQVITEANDVKLNAGEEVVAMDLPKQPTISVDREKAEIDA